MIRLLKTTTLFACLLLGGQVNAISEKETRQEIVRATMEYLSIPYLWGGTEPDVGLDCSAFVQLVFEQAGLYLPRVSVEQYRDTQKLKPEEIQPGDLIFFSMRRPKTKRIDHVGIYVGKNFFVHASYSNGIQVDDITGPYYKRRFIGVRRHREL